MVFGEVLTPGAIFVVVPVVIVLVLLIVNADLDAGLLRPGRKPPSDSGAARAAVRNSEATMTVSVNRACDLQG